MSARDRLRERDPLGDIEEALSFQVSPDFGARVRQRVAAEPRRARLFISNRLAVAAVAVLATGAGVIATLRYLDVEVAQVTKPRGITASAPVVPQGEPAGSVEPVRLLRTTARLAEGRTVSSFEALVPDDQLRALDRLLASMREGRGTVPLAASDNEVNDRGERVPRALFIEPVIIELLAGTPAEPNKNPVKDPNK